MNNPINKPIVDFINQFNLIKPDGLINFNARIVYVVNGVPHQYKCEVTIVTIKAKQLDAIYLLDNHIKSDGLEDMFTIKNEKIKYIPDNGLFIQRDNGFRVYILPVTAHNEKKELTENLVDFLKEYN